MSLSEPGAQTADYVDIDTMIKYWQILPSPGDITMIRTTRPCTQDIVTNNITIT